MSDTADALVYARECGFPTRTEPVVAVDADAARRVGQFASAVAVSVSHGVVELLTDHVPTPDEYAAWSASSGNDVAVVVTTSEILEGARDVAVARNSEEGSQSLAALVERLTEDNPSLELVTFRPGHLPLLVAAGAQFEDSSAGKVTYEAFDALSDSVGGGCVLNLRNCAYRVRRSSLVQDPVITVARVCQETLTLADISAPSCIEQLLGGSRSLVFVLGQPRSGCSTAAAAVANALVQKYGQLVQVVSDVREPWMPASWLHSESLADGGAESVAVTLVDDPASLAALDDAVQLACRGQRVVVTVHGSSIETFVSWAAQRYGPAVVAGVSAGVIRCVKTIDTVGQTVVLYEVLGVDDVVAQELSRTGSVSVYRSMERQGNAGSVALEWLLAAAVSRGEVDEGTAAGLVADSQRWSAAQGHFPGIVVSN